MKNCSDFRDNICAYIDNELAADERNSFEKHLEICPECKRETEEMRCIFGLCADIPLKELPCDFSSELHTKLVAVAERQDNKIIPIKKSKSYKITSAVASIAASLLIIFLAGNFYKYGINAPKGTSSDSAYSLDQNNEINPAAGMLDQETAKEDGGLFSKAMSEEANDTVSALDGKPEAALFADMYEESDRSYAFEESRELAIAGRKQMAMPETASIKYSSITLMADDPASEVSKIRQIALSNNADVIENKSLDDESSDSITAFSLPPASEAEQKTELNIKIQHSQYDRFIEELKEIYGIADLQVGAFVAEDMSEILSTNISISNDIDNQIQELRKNDSEENTEEIKKLQSDKESVDNLIEEIRLGSDEVTVNIYINKK